MAGVGAVFAGKAIATSVITYVINKAFDYLKDNKEAGGLKPTRERLEKLLPQIKVVLDAVDTEHIGDQSDALDAWLWQLRDAVELAEDALDELEYYKLEREAKKIQAGSKVSGSLHQYKGKIVQRFNHTFNTGSLKRLKNAVKALADVASGVERFIQVLNQFGNKVNFKQEVEFKNLRETSSLPHSLVLGREEESNIVVQWLTKRENSASEQIVGNIPIFCIVGLGGIGKTTLAQVICNDNKVKDYFDLFFWVCVSHIFDVETLTRKILQGVTRTEIGMIGLDALHKALQEKLSSRTFLLVLDDVWNDESLRGWETLVSPLRYGKTGSKILLTTRMESVANLAARVMQGECQSLSLSGLKETELLLLLERHAFFGVNPDDYRNLQHISKKMVSKLSGSPLAAKFLGGLLNNKRDSNTWNRILASSVHNIQQGKEGIMTVLRLSYQHLPTHLQSCFRYCSLFHKDYEFTKKELVYLWMGSGLIQQSVDGMTPEDVGMGYLDALTRKSFFEIKSRPRSSRDIKCRLFEEYYEEQFVVHDLLHELARSASVNECARVSISSEKIPNTIRHLCLDVISLTVVEQISRSKKLRTLIMHFQEQDQAEQEHMLKKVLAVTKSLRVLSLTANYPFKLPDAVGDLVHLRYLSLSLMWGEGNTTHSCWFPQVVYNLYHLQTMKFNNPRPAVPMEGQMEGMCKLVNLRHLHLTLVIRPMIPFIGKLTSLHELYGFSIQQKVGYTIVELKNLRDIRHLHVSGLENVCNIEEAAEIMLDQKEHLSAVTLVWAPGSSDSCDPSKADAILDKLQPHSNTSKLQLEGYPGSRPPFWLQDLILINLTYIYLRDCQSMQCLPYLGHLPSLQYLYIVNMKSVECVDSSFYGSGEKPSGLQSLKVLEIENMPVCTEWVGLEGENLFPRLETLAVRDCQELRRLPTLPTSIRQIEIDHAGLQAMPTFFVSSDGSSSSMFNLSLSKLMISNCPYITTLWHGCSLYALEELSIQQCASLSCLPEDSFSSCSSLKTLEIVKCPNLIARQIMLPHTMRTITFGLCANAELALLDSLTGLKYLKRIFLDGCAMSKLPLQLFAGLIGLTHMVLNACSIAHLPTVEAFARLINLEYLFIWDCKELVSLIGIQGLASLMSLTIASCDKLVEDSSILSPEDADSSGLSLNLSELDIDHPSILLREPLRSVTTIKRLQISGGPNLALLPEEYLLHNCHALEELVLTNASHLQCLPQAVTTLTSLQSMHINNAVKIQTLPDMPASLTSLHIYGCSSELKKRCQKHVGHDWVKIAHISDADIR